MGGAYAGRILVLRRPSQRDATKRIHDHVHRIVATDAGLLGHSIDSAGHSDIVDLKALISWRGLEVEIDCAFKLSHLTGMRGCPEEG